MVAANRFLLRKKCFDFLSAELGAIATVGVEHPQQPSTKPIIIVTCLGNASNLQPTASINPDIQISYYAPNELELTKPAGVIHQVETVMDDFLKTKDMPGYSNGCWLRSVDAEYISRIRLFAGYSVYRFFLG